MDEPVERREFEEFKKRSEEKHVRINERLRTLEESDKKMFELTLSVREMTVCVKSMAEELSRQGSKLEELDARDGDMWRKTTAYIVTGVAGTVIGYLFQRFIA